MNKTKVKICGVATPEHALVAAEAGADFVGLILADSRRRVSLEEAKAIVEELQGFGRTRPMTVGVFVNTEPDAISVIVRDVGFDLIQISGEARGYSWDKFPQAVIKAIHVAEANSRTAELANLRHLVAAVSGNGLLPLLDTKVEGSYGGSGRTFDWEAAKGLAEEFEFLMAGGLTPDNVAHAIATVNPWGVDVSSGVETDGVKDPRKIRAFVRAVRDAV